MLIKNLHHTPNYVPSTSPAAEAAFGVFKNSEGATIPADAVCQMSLSTPNGIKMVQPNTAELDAVVGVADAAIADASFGLVQTYGYRATSKVLLTDTSQAAGLKMVPVAGQDYLASVAAGDGRDGLFVLLESHTTGTGTTSKKIHIRAM
jgi:hypothetical protein